MTVSIRRDWCIALRMIALHEYYRKQRILLEEMYSKKEFDEIQKEIAEELERLNNG